MAQTTRSSGSMLDSTNYILDIILHGFLSDISKNKVLTYNDRQVELEILVLPTATDGKSSRNSLIAAVLPVLPMCHTAQINLVSSGHRPCSPRIMKSPSGTVWHPEKEATVGSYHPSIIS